MNLKENIEWFILWEEATVKKFGMKHFFLTFVRQANFSAHARYWDEWHRAIVTLRKNITNPIDRSQSGFVRGSSDKSNQLEHTVSITSRQLWKLITFSEFRSKVAGFKVVTVLKVMLGLSIKIAQYLPIFPAVNQYAPFLFKEHEHLMGNIYHGRLSQGKFFCFLSKSQVAAIAHRYGGHPLAVWYNCLDK